MNTERIRDRIRKLLAVANDAGAYSAEAATAMEMAARLMAEVGVTEEELRKTEGADGPLSRQEIDSAQYKWQVHVAAAAAKLYGAFVLLEWKWTSKGRQKVIVFHGPDDVVDAAEQTYRWFWKQITVLWNEYLKSHPGADANARQTFRLAAAFKVRERVNELVSRMEIKAGDGRSLVLVERTTALAQRTRERLQEQDGMKITESRKTVTNIKDWQAYGSGNAAGDNVTLQGAVESGSNTKLIGRGL